MLRWTVLCGCVASLAASASLAVEPQSLREVPCVDRGLPESEHELLSQHRWARLPSFEIVEEPIPPSLMLWPTTTFATPYVANAISSAGETARYASAPQHPFAPAVERLPSGPPPAVAPPAYQLPVPPQASTSLHAEPFTATLPTPMADPAAMVVELFEKLRVSQARAAEARRELAYAQQELAELRNRPAAFHMSQPTPSSHTVMLELRCFELDLTGVAASKLELEGVCPQELVQLGLAALVADGAFDQPAAAPAAVVQTIAFEACPCTSCQEYNTSQQVAVCPVASDKSSGCGLRQTVQDTERFEQLISQLEKAGLIHNISRPRLMTQSGQFAKMIVGRQVAFRTATVAENGSTAEQLNFLTVGTQIDIKPTVTAEGTVEIELLAEWSSVDDEATRKNGRPVINRQSVESLIELPAGETAVVAGLVQHRGCCSSQPVVVHGTPYENQDRLFKAATQPIEMSKRTEFVVLLTPKVITSALVARPVADTVTR